MTLLISRLTTGAYFQLENIQFAVSLALEYNGFALKWVFVSSFNGSYNVLCPIDLHSSSEELCY